MKATIFLHELRVRLRSIIIWSLSTAAIVLVFFAIYPSFAEEAALMNELMQNFPPQLRAAFGLDNMDLSSVVGFISFLLIFVQICLSVQAGNYGFGLVSVEENELTADFLLTKPVSRFRVLTSKLMAALVSLLITDLAVTLGTFAAIFLFSNGNEYDTSVVWLMLASLVLFQLFFLCVGLLISLLVKRVRSVTPYSLGLGFGSYVLAAFSGIFGDIKLEIITPFKHFDLAYIAREGSLDTPLVLLNLGVTLVSLLIAYWLYLRRDIPAVS